MVSEAIRDKRKRKSHASKRALRRRAVYLALFATLLCTMTLSLAMALAGCRGETDHTTSLETSPSSDGIASFSINDIPEYQGEPSVAINDGTPLFTEDDLNSEPFEHYSELDSLGRCGQAFALVGPETMPIVSRGSIGAIRPSGWQISKYDWIDGKYLFNRCHLIAFALAGENDNPLNLITGTRYLNATGMLPHEERVAGYIRQTDNHVLYRVTPVFEGDNLVATGVLMEAESIEDAGAGIRFCVWCYNIEPGVEIDYATGNNWPSGAGQSENAEQDRADSVRSESPEQRSTANAQAEVETQGAADNPEVRTYILNTNTKRFHLPTCDSVSHMKEKNRQEFEGTRDEIIELGYKPCGSCNP